MAQFITKTVGQSLKIAT